MCRYSYWKIILIDMLCSMEVSDICSCEQIDECIFFLGIITLLLLLEYLAILVFVYSGNIFAEPLLYVAEVDDLYAYL